MSLGSARDNKAAWGAVGSLARDSLQKAFFFFSLGSKGQDPAEPRLQLCFHSRPRGSGVPKTIGTEAQSSPALPEKRQYDGCLKKEVD